MVQLIVRQATLGEVEEADVIAQLSCESLNEGCLAGSWRAM
jgi:hypothetical protein